MPKKWYRSEARTYGNVADQLNYRRAMIGNGYFSRDDVLDFDRMVAIENVGISDDFQKQIVGCYKENLGVTSTEVTKLDAGQIKQTLDKVDNLVKLVEKIYADIQRQFVAEIADSDKSGRSVVCKISAEDQKNLRTALAEVDQIMNRPWYRAGLTRNYQKGAISRIYEFAKYLCNGKEQKLASRAQFQEDDVQVFKFNSKKERIKAYEDRFIKVRNASENMFNFQEAKRDLDDIRKNIIEFAVANQNASSKKVTREDLEKEKEEVLLTCQHGSTHVEGENKTKGGNLFPDNVRANKKSREALKNPIDEQILANPPVWNSPSFRYLYRLYWRSRNAAAYVDKKSPERDSSLNPWFVEKIEGYMQRYFVISINCPSDDQRRYEFAKLGKEIASELSNENYENLALLNGRNYDHLEAASKAQADAKKNGVKASDEKRTETAVGDYLDTYDYLLFNSTTPFFEAMEKKQKEDFAFKISQQQVLRERNLSANVKNWAEKIKFHNHPAEKAIKTGLSYAWGSVASAAKVFAQICAIQNIVTRGIMVDIPAYLTQQARGFREGRQATLRTADPGSREKIKKEFETLCNDCMYGFTMIQQLPYYTRYIMQFVGDLNKAKHYTEKDANGKHTYKYEDPDFRLLLNPVFDLTVLGMHASNKYKNTKELYRGILDQYYTKFFDGKSGQKVDLKKELAYKQQISAMSVFEMAKEFKEQEDSNVTIPGMDFMRRKALLDMVGMAIDQADNKREIENREKWNKRIETINEELDSEEEKLKKKPFETLFREFKGDYGTSEDSEAQAIIAAGEKSGANTEQLKEQIIKYRLETLSAEKVNALKEEGVIEPSEMFKKNHQAHEELKKMLSDALHNRQLSDQQIETIFGEILTNLEIKEGKTNKNGKKAPNQVVFKDDFLRSEIHRKCGLLRWKSKDGRERKANDFFDRYKKHQNGSDEKFEGEEKKIADELDRLNPANYIGALIAANVSISQLQNPKLPETASEKEREAREAQKRDAARAMRRFDRLQKQGKIWLPEKTSRLKSGNNQSAPSQDPSPASCEEALAKINDELQKIDEFSGRILDLGKEKQTQAKWERLALLREVRLRWMDARTSLLQHRLDQLKNGTSPDASRQALIEDELKKIDRARAELVAITTELDKAGQLKDVEPPLTAEAFEKKWLAPARIEKKGAELSAVAKKVNQQQEGKTKFSEEADEASVVSNFSQM